MPEGGRDDDYGQPLADGSYPCRLRVLDGPGGEVMGVQTRMVRVDCAAPVRRKTWGEIKVLYR